MWPREPDGERIRRLVREQAAEIVAGLGPAALEIIAEFRAVKWRRYAEGQDDQHVRTVVLVRSVEWRRIALSCSLLLTWGAS